MNKEISDEEHESNLQYVREYIEREKKRGLVDVKFDIKLDSDTAYRKGVADYVALIKAHENGEFTRLEEL